MKGRSKRDRLRDGARRSLLTGRFTVIDQSGKWHAIQEFTDHVAFDGEWQPKAKRLQTEAGDAVVLRDDGAYLLPDGTIARRLG
jgi:hypothetical protein